MDLKEKLTASFLAFENQVDTDTYVHDVRSEAIKIFEEKGFPTKKEEAWKYTSLNAILKHDFSCLIICDLHPQFGTAPTHRSMSTVFDCHQHAFAASVKFLYGSVLSNFHKKIKKPKR